MVAGHPQLPQAEAPAGSHFSMVPQAGHLTVGREGPDAGRFGLPSLASADLPLRLVKPRGCTWLPGLGGVGLFTWMPRLLPPSLLFSEEERPLETSLIHSSSLFNPSALQPSTVPFFFLTFFFHDVFNAVSFIAFMYFRMCLFLNCVVNSDYLWF